MTLNWHISYTGWSLISFIADWVMAICRCRTRALERRNTSPREDCVRLADKDSVAGAADATAWIDRESSGAADIVWVIGKGDSCDPFTQDDAGRTPASQLLCHHHAQLPAGGKRLRQAFWQVSRQARPQRTSNLPSLSTDGVQADTWHGGQPGSGAALLFRQDTQAPSVSRVLALPPGPAPSADGAQPGGSCAIDRCGGNPVSTNSADDALRHRHATQRTGSSQSQRYR